MSNRPVDLSRIARIALRQKTATRRRLSVLLRRSITPSRTGAATGPVPTSGRSTMSKSALVRFGDTPTCHETEQRNVLINKRSTRFGTLTSMVSRTESTAPATGTSTTPASKAG